MIRIHEKQLPSLGEFDEATLHAVMKVMRIEDNGMRAIDDSKMGQHFASRSIEWLGKQPPYDAELDAVTNPPDPPQPAKPAPMKVGHNAADVKAAQERYKYWVTQGLQNTVENGNLIDNWFALNEPDYSAAGLDRAIQACRASLQWYTPPVIEHLPNGDQRMPLEARPGAKWTKAQLQDWDARRRAVADAERRKRNTEIAKEVAKQYR